MAERYCIGAGEETPPRRILRDLRPTRRRLQILR